MKLTQSEFRMMPQKSITLIGMSGAGKTHISCQLQKWGWENYSCDLVIAEKYLKDALSDTTNLSAENIGALSIYLGKLGNPEKGGFLMDTFAARQKAYYDAECKALLAMDEVLRATGRHFIHDSTGSLCEIEDDHILEKIGQSTLFVYLKTDAVEEEKVLQRAFDYPKPLFFPPSLLQELVATFLDENDLDDIAQITPDDFTRWVFPKLFAARKPKYQALADQYGVAIPASAFADLRSAQHAVDIIAEHLEE